MRRVRYAYVLSLLLVSLLTGGLRGAGRVSATTGVTDFGPVPARFKLAHQVEHLYLGQYTLRSVAPGSRIISGQMAIDVNDLGYLQGIGSFLSYDAQGYRSERVVTFYDFHLVAPHTMMVELFGALGTPLLGTMAVQRTASGDLIGSIALPKTPYAIAFHRNVAL
jgi:hypothetical protein